MSSSIYKTKAKEFLNLYGLDSVSSDALISVLKQQGYEVIYLNCIESHNEVERLLKEIECSEYARMSKSFTYKDEQNKIVFIDGNLQELDRLHALAHEEGHIFCGHMERTNCSLANVEDEWEANEFAHYVTSVPVEIKISHFCKLHHKALITLICLFVICALSIPIVNGVQEFAKKKQGYVKTVDYYVTGSGTKYHLENCRFIKEASIVRKLTEEEYNSGQYEACKECIK